MEEVKKNRQVDTRFQGGQAAMDSVIKALKVETIQTRKMALKVGSGSDCCKHLQATDCLPI
jgi:hypothetical protein